MRENLAKQENIFGCKSLELIGSSMQTGIQNATTSLQLGKESEEESMVFLIFKGNGSKTIKESLKSFMTILEVCSLNLTQFLKTQSEQDFVL